MAKGDEILRATVPVELIYAESTGAGGIMQIWASPPSKKTRGQNVCVWNAYDPKLLLSECLRFEMSATKMLQSDGSQFVGILINRMVEKQFYGTLTYQPVGILDRRRSGRNFINEASKTDEQFKESSGAGN